MCRLTGSLILNGASQIVSQCNVAHVFAIEIARATTHNRLQILYYLAGNLPARGDVFARRIGDMTGVFVSPAKARAEVGARR